MRVQDVMARNPITVEVTEPVSCAARLMRERNIGSIPALDAKGRLRGMLTDRDIVLRCVAAGRDPAKVEIEQIMSAGAVTAAPGEDVTAALARMKSEQVRRLPVVEGETLVGILSLADVARTQRFDMEAAQALSGITANVCRK
ncbi:MAG: CBS domain-containing protein [Oscillospiraceae bacterium]|nr:CBS domain-containing protein [Oscillospiraceae bacterium]